MDRNQQTPSTSTLLRRMRHLSPCYDEEPQLFLEQEGLDPIEAVECITPQEKVMLLLAMVRSMGWRSRYVTAFRPIPLKLTVDHPLFKVPSPPTASLDVKPPAEGNVATCGSKQSGRKESKKSQKSAAATSTNRGDAIDLVSNEGGDEERKAAQKDIISMNDDFLSWIEVLRSKDEAGEKEKAVTYSKKSKTKPGARWTSILLEQKSIDQPELVENILAWMDNDADDANKSSAQGKLPKGKWTSKIDRGNAHRTTKKSPVSYVLAVEHVSLNPGVDNLQGVRFTDVTRRYASTWSRTLSLRGASSKDIKELRGQCIDEWFQTSMKRLNDCFKPVAEGKDVPTKPESKSQVRSVTKVKGSNGKLVEVFELESSDDEDTTKPAANDNADHFDNNDHILDEKAELNDNSMQEVIPTSKAAFKNHPFYVIPSVFNSREVLHPDARKRICGVFKGELVYRRSDISTALTAKKWLYEGRKVKDSELQNPAKMVKARKKPTKKGFQALESYGITQAAQDEAISLLHEKKNDAEDENMDSLYGIWQTSRWSPPYVSPSDPIPTNEFKNVEKVLLNPGLTHIQQPRLAGIARKLGVPYAPCMLGFERNGGRGTPLIRGIVVHDHNVTLIREASIEWESHVAEKERDERRKEVLKKWKRLVVGLLTKERLERDYGNH
jgi:xeroderma pigmentosum group C-complementing protein